MMWMSNRLTVFVWKCRVEVEWWVDLIQRDWEVDGLCCVSLGFFPVLFNVFGSRGQLETTCSSKHEREKKLSSRYQSSALWRVRSEASGILQLKVWSLCWASLWGRFLSWKAISFCLELWRGGELFAGRMWVCWRAFAQRKRPTLSPGRRRLPDGPFFLCLILKRRLCSSSPVWTGIVLFEGIVLSNTKLRDTAECQVFLINVLSGCMDFRHGEPYCVPTRSLCALDHAQKHCPGWVYLTNGTSERWCVSWADSRKSRTEGVVMMKS